MANGRQFRNLIFNLSFSAAIAALAIAFVLTVVARQPAQAQAFKILHTFTGGQDGANPYSGVTFDKAGNLYGTAYYGGTGDYGTVYQLKHKGSGWTFNPLYSFAGGSDGAYPQARVIFGPNGTLYGTAFIGGSYGYGTAFNLRPSAAACRTALCPWKETVLYNFTGGTDGGYPGYGDLTLDQAGDIYGTTQTGGKSMGVVYELTPPGSWNLESVLYAFSGRDTDGAFPFNGVIFDNAGNLYGTTWAGGVGGVGTVFELMYPGWTECTLNNFFNGNDGGYVNAGLIFDQSGNLYGATSGEGKNNGGTVFELTPGANCSWTLDTLYSFTHFSGDQCGPRGTLAMDGAGNLYGTTYCDGAYGYGNVFELTYPNWTYTSLHDFTGGSDGGNPVSNVVFDSRGNLYGTTYYGGDLNCDGGYGCGVVWEITP